MARKFLYFVATCIVLVIVALIVLRIWAKELTAIAFVPTAEFTEQAALEPNAYAASAMWFSHPDLAGADPIRWQPPSKDERSLLPTQADLDNEPSPDFALFYVHATSYVDRSSWNAPLEDAEVERITRIYLAGMASPFNKAREIWAPRYRQATFGAFLTDGPEGQLALDLAYRDVAQAFAQFRRSIGDETPIVIAGHSQGSLHLLRILKEKIAGTPLADRLVAAYLTGWPISVEHDLPSLGVPACSSTAQTGCIMSWSSFAEPADPSLVLEAYANSVAFDGELRGTSQILCSNPIKGSVGGRADAAENLGTLVPGTDLSDGELVAGAVPARCDGRGLLLIGDPPEMGNYVLPGNNYHVYDVPLFWANLQRDVGRRAQSWAVKWTATR
jgi:hypothetical protein